LRADFEAQKPAKAVQQPTTQHPSGG
jgi:hypothetical protein